VPVAILSAVKTPTPPQFTSPRKDPERLSRMHFSVQLAPEINVVDFLLADRKRR